MPIKSSTSIKLSSLLISFSLAACGGKTLTVENAGDGNVSSKDGFIDCGETCQHKYNTGSVVNLTATAEEFSVFMNWEGACLGVEPECELTMDQSVQVSSVFNADDEPGIGSLPAVLAGSAFDINYVSIDGSSFVGIYEEQSERNDYINYRTLYSQVGTTRYTAPTTPGTYEWRIYSTREDNPIFSGKQLIVLPYDAFISFEQEAVAGSTIDIAYSGSTSPIDRLGVFEVNSDNRAPIHNTLLFDENGTTKLLMPTISGNYEIRMFNADRETIIADTITILPYDADFSIPSEVVAGSFLEITYSGSTAVSDLIGAFELGSDNTLPISRDYLSLDSGTAELLLPTVAGNYEIRMVNINRETIVAKPITMLPYDAQILAPSEAPASSTIAVTFSGSTNRYDRIGIFDIGSDNSRSLSTTFLPEDSGTASVRLPSAPNQYHIRMINNNRETIEQSLITVTP